MGRPRTGVFALIITVLAVFGLWTAIFSFKVLNFWLGLGLASAALALWGLYLAGLPNLRGKINLQTLLAGLGSAAVLYGIFWLAAWLGPLIFPDAQSEINGIYAIKQEAGVLPITLVLIFITSPAEEIFWRYFLQGQMMIRLGGLVGMLLTALIYAAVHMPSGNLMLVLAALTAGLFWGALYLAAKNIFICVISHTAWAVAVFILWPLSAG